MTTADITSRSVKVRWSPSFAGNSAIIGFLVEYRGRCAAASGLLLHHHHEKSSALVAAVIDKRGGKVFEGEDLGGGGTWQEVFINDPNVQSFVLRDLRPWCTYELQMRAKNSIGLGEASQVVSFRTGEEMPGGPPQDVHVEPVSASSLKIRWKPPDRRLHYGQIKGYYIGYRLAEAGPNSARFNVDSEEQFAYKNVEANSADPNAYEVAYLTNLKRHTLYSIVVQAFNSIGAGPRSDEVNWAIFLNYMLTKFDYISRSLSRHSTSSNNRRWCSR